MGATAYARAVVAPLGVFRNVGGAMSLLEQSGAFKSVRGRKRTCKWQREEVQELAAEWNAALPEAAVELISAGEFEGGLLVNLPEPQFLPREQDAKANLMWTRV
eukprot:5333634-Alexandrium_andersonii.AAC.1